MGRRKNMQQTPASDDGKGITQEKDEAWVTTWICCSKNFVWMTLMKLKNFFLVSPFSSTRRPRYHESMIEDSQPAYLLRQYLSKWKMSTSPHRPLGPRTRDYWDGWLMNANKQPSLLMGLMWYLYSTSLSGY